MSFIQYVAKMEGFIRGVTISFDPERDHIEKVQIEEQNGQDDVYHIKCTLTNVNDQDTAQQITKELLQDILNVISYEYNAITHKPVVNVIQLNGNTHLFVNDTVNIIARAHVQGIVGNPSEDLKKSLKDANLVNALATSVHFQMYKSAMELTDPLSRFMFLYSILLLIKRKQEKVDDFIKTEIPNVEMRKREKTSGSIEEATVFTTLRNSVGHITEKIRMKEVVNDMEKYVGQLAGLTKKAITENII